MTEEERRDALYDALREIVPPEGPVADPVPPPRGTTRGVLALAMGWAFLGYVWIARPAWVFGPSEAVEMTAVRQEAALRFGLYLERARIDDYRDAHGSLPASLELAGPVEDGIVFAPTDSTYVLTGELGAHRLTLTSAMDVDSFLGNSLQALRR